MNLPARRRALRHVCTGLLAAALLGGCATPPATPPAPDHWRGRLALNVMSEPPEHFSAAFTLDGQPEAGELRLFSPLGNTLAVIRWTPGQAVLVQGERSQPHESLDHLLQTATGAPLPVRALFAWLRGEPQAVPGWQVDLSRADSGRLMAQRLMPLPAAELRVVLDR